MYGKPTYDFIGTIILFPISCWMFVTSICLNWCLNVELHESRCLFFLNFNQICPILLSLQGVQTRMHGVKWFSRMHIISLEFVLAFKFLFVKFECVFIWIYAFINVIDIESLHHFILLHTIILATERCMCVTVFTFSFYKYLWIVEPGKSKKKI